MKTPTDKEIEKWAEACIIEISKELSKEILKPESWLDQSKLKIFANGLKVGAKAMRDNLI
jgi:hypothetical protein